MAEQEQQPRRWWDPRRWVADYRKALDEARRSGRRTPMLALVVLLLCSGFLVPGFLVGAEEDGALSASTTARQSAGGDDVTAGSRNSYRKMCRDAPVEFVVEGQTYSGLAYLAGECLTGEATRTVDLRYDPDNPNDFTELPPQRWWIYGFAAAAALGFLATLVAILRRLLPRLLPGRARRRTTAAPEAATPRSGRLSR